METEPRSTVEAGSREGVLVDRARRGDATAFGELYELHLNRIYRYVFYRVGSPTEAEDLTEHVFLKAWEAIGRYESRGLPFTAWLYRMAHNAVIDWYRLKRPTTSIDETFDLEDEKQDLVATIDARFDSAELKKAIQRLNPTHQSVVLMRFVEGLSHAEVGRVLGKSEGAIRVIQHRALAAMAKHISQPALGFVDA